MSNWFYDYLFTPLVASLRSWRLWAVATGAIITFLISGLWHGASLHYVVWGLWYGVALAYEALTRRTRGEIFARMPAWLATFIAWSCATGYTLVGYIFFRSPGLSSAFGYMRSITHHLFSRPALGSFMLIYVLPFLAMDWYFRKNERILSFPKNLFLRYSFYTVLVFAILYHSNDNSGFIYFQF